MWIRVELTNRWFIMVDTVNSVVVGGKVEGPNINISGNGSGNSKSNVNGKGLGLVIVMVYTKNNIM